MVDFTKTDTILDKIIAQKIMDLGKATSRVGLPKIREDAENSPYSIRDFIQALHKPTVALIAECKKASPSKGILIENFDPVALATTYANHGASAISVLTEETFFQGHLEYMRAVREAVSVPVLRKDFVIHAYQIYEARAWGADAVLLIVACLDDKQLLDLRVLIESLRMSALIEVHDEHELERALNVGGRLIGVNNRNLKNFHVDLATTERIALAVPEGITLVSESGIVTTEDVRHMGAMGAHAVLVGETLVKSADIGKAVKELSEVKRENT
jgi:indole-3-glycerol phosphate synthase